MTGRAIVQTSRHKPSNGHIDKLMINAPGWGYAHFNDEEILDFFKNNPTPGFELIEQKFRSIKRGEHRADLFRYYYIYLNGGFFVDLDFELTHDINDVVKNYDFVSASIDNTSPAVLNDTKRARTFNGYFYASRNHPIVLQALLHLYNLELHNLGPENGEWDSRYHVVCEFLYNLIASYPDKENIKIYSFIDGPDGGFIFNGLQKLGQHKGSVKEGIPYTLQKLPNEDSGFNKKDVVLFFCKDTSWVDFNSGIQRYTRKLAISLLEAGVKLIPVIANENKDLSLPDMHRLEIFSRFDGPPQSSWPTDLFSKSKEELLGSASHIINPELTDHWADGELLTFIKSFTSKGIKYVSVLHDTIAVKQNQLYSEQETNRSMKFLNEISASDVIISVSDSTKKDYHSIVNDYHNTNVKSVSLLLPREIYLDNAPNPKINYGKDINILCVSAFEKRKNHLFLLESFEYAKKYLSKDGYKLGLKFISAYKAGDQDFINQIYKKSEELGVEISIGASEHELKQSYLEADFSIYPSLYEGFGFPIAESLSFNTPVICSNTSSMIEIAESLGHCGIKTFDPSDSRALSDLIIQMTLDSGLRHQMAKQISNIKPVSWSDYVKKFLSYI